MEIEALSESDGRVNNTNADSVFNEMKRIVADTQTDLVNTHDTKHLYEAGSMSKVTFHDSLKKLIAKGKVKKMEARGVHQIIAP